MYELAMHYWWVFLFTVPALAMAIKYGTERAGLVDTLSAPLRRKLASLAHSYPGHWVVTATLRDGRRFSRVVVDSRFRLASEAPAPFRLRDVEDLAWEGLVGPPDGPALQLSEGRRAYQPARS